MTPDPKALAESHRELMEALSALSSHHEGFQHGMGPCICAAHEQARKVLATARKLTGDGA